MGVISVHIFQGADAMAWGRKARKLGEYAVPSHPCRGCPGQDFKGVRFVPGPHTGRVRSPFSSLPSTVHWNGTSGRVKVGSSDSSGKVSSTASALFVSDTRMMKDHQNDCVSRSNSNSSARYRASTYALRSSSGVTSSKSSTSSAGSRHNWCSSEAIKPKNKTALAPLPSFSTKYMATYLRTEFGTLSNDELSIVPLIYAHYVFRVP